MTDPFENGQTSPPSNEEGQIVGILVPKSGVSPKDTVKGIKTAPGESKAFRQAFLDTLRGRGEGLLTRYLFHEQAQDKKNGEAEKAAAAMLSRHFGRLLYGGFAWDQHIEHSKSYKLVSGDMDAIDYAVSKQVMDALPEKLHVIEYGTGGKLGAGKPQKLIEAVLQSDRHEISGYTAVDILSRYAIESSQVIHDRFNLQAVAIACDFMGASKVTVPFTEHHTPLSLVFGGTIANAPDDATSGGKTGFENAADFLSNIGRQHGPGSFVLLTFSAERDQEKLMREYQATEAFSAFVLSAFTRAAGEGIITDSSYDPFRYWEMQPRYDAVSKVVKLCAVCKEDHALLLDEGSLNFKKGDSMANIISFKWDEEDYRSLFTKAGFEVVNVYRREGSSGGVILAKVPVPALAAVVAVDPSAAVVPPASPVPPLPAPANG